LTTARLGVTVARLRATPSAGRDANANSLRAAVVDIIADGGDDAVRCAVVVVVARHVGAVVKILNFGFESSDI
jgi:hypothetical protein